MLSINEDEEAVKLTPPTDDNSREDDSDSLVGDTGTIYKPLDYEIMVPDQSQEQRLDTRWWWYITKSKKFYIVLLLLVTISAGGVAVVSHYRRDNNSEVMVTSQVKSGYVNENYGRNNDDDDNYGSSQLNRMAPRSYSRVEPPEEMGHFNIFIREPNSNGRRRPSQRIRFPAARYSRRRFPLVGPFMNFRLSMPIFVDSSTAQTIIHSPRGNIYIIPPLINVYGAMFSIGELIAAEYASFINTGTDMTSIADLGIFFRSGPLMGPGIPKLNRVRGGFDRGVRTRFRSFFPPKFSKTSTDDEYPNYEVQNEDNYQSPSYSYDKYHKKRPETIIKAPTCSDGILNQYEKLVDCGGPCAGKNTCMNGFSCMTGSDCISGVCQGLICQIPTCYDGVKNQNETQVDCGGPCLGKNTCANGFSCNNGSDCISDVCNNQICQIPTCYDGVQNQNETEVDCGGPCVGKNTCMHGFPCNNGSDCKSDVCKTQICQLPTCYDGVKNENEQEVDCGGICSRKNTCADTFPCKYGSDCISESCIDNKCDRTCTPRCKNNGKCISNGNCQCKTDFSGPTCEIQTSSLCNETHSTVFLTTFESGKDQFLNKTPEYFGFHTTYIQDFSGKIDQARHFGFINSVPDNNNAWVTGAQDYTQDISGGYMVFVNGDVAPDQVFNSTINNLCTGVRYEFSAYCANPVRSTLTLALPNLRFQIQDGITGSIVIAENNTGPIPESTSSTTLDWTHYGVSFVTPSSSVILLIISDAGMASGNDFTIDNIALRSCERGPSTCRSDEEVRVVELK